MSEAVTSKKTNLEVVPVAGRIGAEVKGVRLSPDLDQDTADAIWQTLLKYKVIFFKGQQHLDNASQEGFASLFGEPYAHPTLPKKQGTGSILEMDSLHGARANFWHTDITFVDVFPKASILHAVEIPPVGGDTVWANTASAYQDLPEELRALADRLWAMHTNEYDYAIARSKAAVTGDEAAQQRSKVFSSVVYRTEHPVVHVHPETHKRHLLLGGFVRKIIGYSSSDSERLLSIFQDHITRLENTVRWRWSAGDVAIWDNRATQHYAIDDYGDQHRVVRRVTVAGDAAVSVDGHRSVLRSSASE
ncbi:MAG TPA: TauD/TfdA family dioxygenase [Ktedonobacteraceae bacterium]